MDAATDLPQIFRLMLSLVFVLALMGGLAYLLKKLGLARGHKIGGGPRRLKTIETLPLDHRHKVVLIQRDDTQHLVMLGPNGETVVETHIEPEESDEESSA